VPCGEGANGQRGHTWECKWERVGNDDYGGRLQGGGGVGGY
jgi:hypothetical protein